MRLSLDSQFHCIGVYCRFLGGLYTVLIPVAILKSKGASPPFLFSVLAVQGLLHVCNSMILSFPVSAQRAECHLTPWHCQGREGCTGPDSGTPLAEALLLWGHIESMSPACPSVCQGLNLFCRGKNESVET